MILPIGFLPSDSSGWLIAKPIGKLFISFFLLTQSVYMLIVSSIILYSKPIEYLTYSQIQSNWIQTNTVQSHSNLNSLLTRNKLNPIGFLFSLFLTNSSPSIALCWRLQFHYSSIRISLIHITPVIH
jgi:hypothetical protein